MRFTDQWRLLCMMKRSSPGTLAECELHPISLREVQRYKNSGCLADENMSHLELFRYDNDAWSGS